jgi:hypothetical protein
MVISAVGRLAALNLGSNNAAGTERDEAAKRITARRAFVVFRQLLLLAALACAGTLVGKLLIAAVEATNDEKKIVRALWMVPIFIAIFIAIVICLKIYISVRRAMNNGRTDVDRGSSRREDGWPYWRPWSLVVVATLFILYGCIAAWQSSHDLFELIFDPSINIHFFLRMLGIPIGIGLIRRRPKWRVMALIVVWFGAALIFIASGLALTGDAPIPKTTIIWGGHEVTGQAKEWVGLLGYALIVGLFIWFYRVLTRPDVKIQFQKSSRSRPWLEWGILSGALFLVVTISWLRLNSGLDQLNSTLTASSFGPVVQGAVYADRTESMCFDLATGKPITLPSGADPAAWILTGHHTVVMATNAFGKTSLALGNLWSHPIGNGLWNKPWLLDETTAQRLTTNQLEGKSFLEFFNNTYLHQTVAFHVDQHLAGLLQITRFSENPPGVEFRYKLLQNVYYETN